MLTRARQADWVLVLAALGVFFAADDQTSVVAILPEMIESVGLAQDEFYQAAWIINGYILGYIVAMPLMGRIADLFGRGRVYALSLLLFGAGSAWVALSSDLTVMSLGRGVQAVGAGAVVPVAMAIVVAGVEPSRRAFGLGAIAAVSEAGALIGPLWGGGIADLLGWRGVFWINLPLCLPIALALWRLSPRSERRPGGGLDLPGAVLLGVALTFLAVALTDDPIATRPLGQTASLLALAAASSLLFLWQERRATMPLLRLALFRSPAVNAGFLTNALTGGSLIAAMVSVPLFTNVILDGTPLEGGLNLARLTIALPLGALAGGSLAARAGPARAAGLGLAFAGGGFGGMVLWDADPSQALLTLPLLAAGFGFGLVIAPVNTAVLGEVEEGERATVAALLTVMRLLGGLVGVALLTTRGLGSFYIEAGRIPLDDPRFADIVRDLQVDAFQATFAVTALVCLLTLLPAAFLGRRISRGDRPRPDIRNEA